MARVGHSSALVDRPLRVLFVADHLGYAGGVMHGASRYYLDVLPRLNRGGRVRAELFILGEPHPFASRLEEAGVRPVFLGRSKWDPRSLLDLWRIARERDAEVLHLLTLKSGLLGLMVARATGRRALVHLHDLNAPGVVMGAMERRAARWADVALATSEPVAEFAVSEMGMPADRVRVLPNGLDAGAYGRRPPGTRERVRRELGIPAGAPVVGVAGRVVEAKGQRVAIRAMQRVRRNQPEAMLVVIGDGPDLPFCRELAQTLSVPVVFAGQREDMADVLAAVDVAAVPSLAVEGFGYTAIEAAAAGRPVVAFASGGLASLVEHGRTGLLVEAGDEEGLAAALARVLAEPAWAERMGLAGRGLAARFGLEHHVAQLEELYAGLAVRDG